MLEDAAVSCAPNSFSAGTLVVMGDGSTKAMSEVKVGDQLEATDPLARKTVAATVSHLLVNGDHKLADVEVRQVNGSSAELHATQGHHFWDQTLQVLTAQLRPGDTSSRTMGRRSWWRRSTPGTGRPWMYDLTVDGATPSIGL